jgi:hypothetical protein
MRFDGVEAEVETEALHDDEVPRRAIVIRLKNELPELLGFEHLADEILKAGGEAIPVFTPIIPSEYIERIKFNLASLGVVDPKYLYINYAKIHKVRVSEGEHVYYEVDHEHFKPASMSVEEAIAEGLAAYDAYTKELTINVAALREETPGEGELAFALTKAPEASVEVPTVMEAKIDGTTAEVKVEIDGKEVVIPVEVKGAEENADVAISNVIGDTPEELRELLDLAEEFKLNKVLLGVAITTATDKMTVVFKDAATVVDPAKAVVGVVKGETKMEVEPEVSGNDIVAEVDLAALRAEENGEEVVVVLGERSVVPEATTTAETGGGGGGGCSMGAPQSTASGLANLGALLTGLLGLFGFRRKRH